MQKLYNYFYILNSFYPASNEEIIIDFQSINELDEILNELPECEPSNEVLERIFRFV